MEKIIEEIKKYLKYGKYANEEQIKLSVVVRLLDALGWDIWDPTQLILEFKPHQENNKTADIALFNYSTPCVILEIKASGRLLNQRTLTEAETQLHDYNHHYLTPFTILTDGDCWRFYHSQWQGSFRDRLFREVNFKDEQVDIIERTVLPPKSQA